MEFEFETNWANYSWFVGDIFGAPLAIEWLFAFFLEATFFCRNVFFGWDKVSKKFHLFSTWCCYRLKFKCVLDTCSKHGWMQNPVGTTFNPDTARNETVDFIQIALSPTAISKFLHTVKRLYISIFLLLNSDTFLFYN